MKTTLFCILLTVTSMVLCAKENEDNTTMQLQEIKTKQLVPFLTKQNDFVYVDKTSLKPINNMRYQSATLFNANGYAVVENKEGKNAVIDASGKVVIDYIDGYIDLKVVNGLTLYKKRKEYVKKLPIYKWEWNVLSNYIKKEEGYRKTEIGIVETKQVLFKADDSYTHNGYYLDFTSMDANHVYWNNAIYQIKNKQLSKIKDGVLDVYSDKKYLKSSKNTFAMYTLDSKEPVLSGLFGVDNLSVLFNNESITLTNVNKERFANSVSKLLVDSKDKRLYAYPEYEKAFPQTIVKATPTQIDFLKQTTLVYSITGSPYFLLGVFNADHAVFAYEWRYIDTEGIMYDQLPQMPNFKILDQIGRLVWPDKNYILPSELLTDGMKIKEVYSFDGDLYAVVIENTECKRTKGLWDSKSKTWKIKPANYNISVLDLEQGIYALQREKEGLYILYNDISQQMITDKQYSSIGSNGLVSSKNENNELIYYYIDIYSGQEYREM